jgi:hypothetical protein
VAKTPSGTTNTGSTEPATTVAGKGHATPTRKEKEAARKRPLVSGDRAEARRTSRAQMQEQRERARVGMARGEEKYLPVRDRGPQKRYVRDYVDARFSIGEILIPVMFLVLIVSFVPQFGEVTYLILWGFFAVAVIDVIVLGFILKRKLAAKFGADRVEKVRFYAATRALQLRMMRLPKPQVKRGKFPV